MFQKNYHDTGENQFSTEHIGGLLSITFSQLMEQLHPKTGNPLAVFNLSILSILCIPNVSKKSIMAQENINHMHNTKEILVIVAWKNILLAHGSATALNGESLGIFLVYLYFINIMSSVVVMDHRIF